ncbi:MAG: valine--tRNA ligase [Clostridiales bacterium]|nr:valine--tRNA ligase [Clostridiales bacterium]
MSKELEKSYDPGAIEAPIYDFWCKNNYFHAEVNPEKKPYTIVIPPPNITGKLHMGHALDNTLQDIIIRFKRMQGYETLWLPGTDHASIATEAKLVEALRAEGLSKEEIGRDEFLRRAWAWKDEYSERIIGQLKKIGSSCDWARERFTLDEGCSDAVGEVFVNLYNKGLIYKGRRMVNWCPHCITTISDAEVEYEDIAGHFWHLKYPFADGSGYIELATTRPETLLGDTAVAVNPNDERYKDLIGKKLILPIVHREIELIADEYVDVEFGTGAVKITPAHDPNDYEVGLRHSLEIIDVMTDDGHIAPGWGKYSGMDRYECRNEIVKDLEAEGALIKTEDYSHNVGTCYRCHTTIEPRLSNQWFVKMQPLAEPAVKAVKDGRVKFVPERFAKTYYHWMENIKDWCISRQLWWGHRIPAYYCADCGEITVQKGKVTKCSHCGSTNIRQDEDTLDTWFSSALWPFSTLGYPKKTPEYEYFYPTNTLVTGYDIIFFWVARMIFSAIEHTGTVPFDTVFIHGIVRDSQGRKMSKSLGNGIDPLDVIAEYGADALRFTLANGNSPGNDMRFSDEKVKASAGFANKLWNAARFVLMNLEDGFEYTALPQNMRLEDKWIITRLNAVAGEVTENIEKFELGIAISKLYDFPWSVFCDWYVEISKIRMQNADMADEAKNILVYVLTGIIKLLHPFMPFITEAIYQALPHECESICISSWVSYDEKLDFAAEAQEFERVIAAVRAVRNRRNEMNIKPSRKANILIETDFTDTFESCISIIKKLAMANEVIVKKTADAPQNSVAIITNDAKIYIPMSQLVDFAAERQRLGKEIAAAGDKLEFIEKKLGNESFVNKAPEAVVQKNRAEAKKLAEKIRNLKAALAELSE